MDQLQKDSFVSLGGPKANGVSDHVLSRLADRLPVRYDAAEGCFFFGGGQFRAAYSPSGLVTQDYGLIIRLLKLDRNGPDAKPALVVFGLHGHGTEQAIKAITANAHLARTLKPHIKQDLFAFLKFDFVEHKCIKSEIIGANSIP
ncbi:hypothetical protein [Bradyrhizobium amphicarpaeae]|uniref:Uncharacterized protein n=1 Tax=Bradyrhizobium amphicarpaeae TaxID=1404768 RepID=A0A2U8PUB3_9BRAD|nr:hypothetical protein [Bradyrhizobium amphicarpaeae]AWM01211.1 hypothetical protein CIT40_14985 [Bradyrhizobium amphicarpaeae]